MSPKSHNVHVLATALQKYIVYSKQSIFSINSFKQTLLENNKNDNRNVFYYQ
jgi:hypothetical protein